MRGLAFSRVGALLFAITALAALIGTAVIEVKCQSSCSSPAKLFYSAIPGQDAGEMVALTGERYGEIANAFRYRSEYVEGCACKPNPGAQKRRSCSIDAPSSPRGRRTR